MGFSPAHPEGVGGLIEIPALAGSLTLNKGDFLRTGPRGALFLAYRKAVQEAVTDPSPERATQLTDLRDQNSAKRHKKNSPFVPPLRNGEGVLGEDSAG